MLPDDLNTATIVERNTDPQSKLKVFSKSISYTFYILFLSKKLEDATETPFIFILAPLLLVDNPTSKLVLNLPGPTTSSFHTRTYGTIQYLFRYQNDCETFSTVLNFGITFTVPDIVFCLNLTVCVAVLTG
jgi:hypothetical protein